MPREPTGIPPPPLQLSRLSQMGAGKLAASSCHGDRTVGKPVSWEGKEGERRKQRLGVGWGGGAGGGWGGTYLGGT